MLDAAADGLPNLLLWKIALIAAAGAGAQWLAWRLNWPAILFLGLAGLALGPVSGLFGAPLVDPALDFGPLLLPAAALALAVLLFESGLNLNAAELRAAGAGGRRFILAGAVSATILGALAARLVMGLSWDLALLFGALMAITGPAVVSPLLRRARIAGRPGVLLRAEGVVNDALGPLLAVLVYEVAMLSASGAGALSIALSLALAALTGVVLGVAAGIGLSWVFRRGHAPELLKAPLVLASVLAVFVLADAVAHAAGFLAVTVFGATLANLRVAPLAELRRFRESVSVILISSVIVVLAAGLTQAAPGAIGWRGVLLAAILLLAVRPLSAMISSVGAGLTAKERALAAGLAPRGAAGILAGGVLAAELVSAGRGDAAVLPPLLFLLMFVSILAHGFSVRPLARRLNLAKSAAEGVLIVGASAWSVGLARAIADLGIPVTMADASYRRLRKAREAGLQSFIGEVLSEQADQRLDHASLGQLVAATANDAYNALVCVQFAPQLGRHRVWQLAGFDEGTGGKIVHGSRGAALIGAGRGFESLAHDWWAGWRFRAARLTATYTLEQLKADRPGCDMVLEQRPDGSLSFLGAGEAPRGLPGCVILTFGPPRAEAAGPAAAETTPGQAA